MKEYLDSVICCLLTFPWGLTVILLAAAVLGAAVLFFARRKIWFLTPLHLLIFGTFLSATIYFVPFYSAEFSHWQTFFVSVQHALRLFALDGDFIEQVAQKAGRIPETARECYLTFGAFLFCIAPLLTFGFILSFFKDLAARIMYTLFCRTTHVFSELNEKSLAMARSIAKNCKHLIVFTDIIDKKEELCMDLIDDAEALGAILFRKDLEEIRFKWAWTHRKLKFYLLSEDESEKIRHAQHIINRYNNDKCVTLRIFSDDIRTELLIDSSDIKQMDVERINDIQMLIYHELYENGVHLFEKARVNDNGEKVISAVIVGLGKYGREMLKALTWYCQMTGYKLKITAFDSDLKAEEKFKALCPDLLNPAYNKQKIEGDAYYEIDIFSGVDVTVPDFESRIRFIHDATFFFVCLGDDKINMTVSANIRSITEQIQYVGNPQKPVIETVIYDSNIRTPMSISWEDLFGERALSPQKITNFKSEPYNIMMIGDLDTFYSAKTLIDSDLRTAGFHMHKDYSVTSAKFDFVTNRMADEWEAFLNHYGLAESWRSYLKENAELAAEARTKMAQDKENALRETTTRKNQKTVADHKWYTLLGVAFSDEANVSEEETDKPRYEEKAEPTLSESLNNFDFLTLEEKEFNLSKKIRGNIKAERAFDWEQRVYSKMPEILGAYDARKEWAETEAKILVSAEKSFRIEYNRRSSIAKAIHRRLRLDPRMPNTIPDKQWEDLSLAEKIKMGTVEHIRWNAYMRADGYRYATKRNDLAKLHHNLVPVSELSNNDLRKDA